MKTTSLPPHRQLAATAPAQPIGPRPLWEAHRLFQEPQFPEGLGLLEDDGPDDDSDG